MTKALDISAEERVARNRERNRLYQITYRKKHGDVINARRRKVYDENTNPNKAHQNETATTEPIYHEPEPAYIPATHTPAPTPAPAPTSAPAERKTLKIEDAVREISASKNPIFDKPKTRSTYISGIRRIKKITGCDDLIECLKNPTELIKKIDESEEYKINSKKSTLETIVNMIPILNIPLSMRVLQDYKNKRDIYTFQSKQQTDEKLKNAVFTPYPDYLKKLKEKIGTDSKMYLLARIFQVIPQRDDFQLKIVKKLADTADKTMNYIVVNGTDNVIVQTNKYKTADNPTNYGNDTEDTVLNRDTSDLVRKYIKSNPSIYTKAGGYLFGKSKLTAYVNKQNRSVGFDGGFSLMRKMITSVPKTLEEAALLANKMKHSLSTAMATYTSVKSQQPISKPAPKPTPKPAPKPTAKPTPTKQNPLDTIRMMTRNRN